MVRVSPFPCPCLVLARHVLGAEIVDLPEHGLPQGSHGTLLGRVNHLQQRSNLHLLLAVPPLPLYLNRVQVQGSGALEHNCAVHCLHFCRVCRGLRGLWGLWGLRVDHTPALRPHRRPHVTVSLQRLLAQSHRDRAVSLPELRVLRITIPAPTPSRPRRVEVEVCTGLPQEEDAGSMQGIVCAGHPLYLLLRPPAPIPVSVLVYAVSAVSAASAASAVAILPLVLLEVLIVVVPALALRRRPTPHLVRRLLCLHRQIGFFEAHGPLELVLQARLTVAVVAPARPCARSCDGGCGRRGANLMPIQRLLAGHAALEAGTTHPVPPQRRLPVARGQGTPRPGSHAGPRNAQAPLLLPSLSFPVRRCGRGGGPGAPQHAPARHAPVRRCVLGSQIAPHARAPVLFHVSPLTLYRPSGLRASNPRSPGSDSPRTGNVPVCRAPSIAPVSVASPVAPVPIYPVPPV
mmetsp:Transcript_4296/g.9648  ORF Transcript_4296/g.9648 Transcript_4296/m.9648 type:complete len:460 (+) Transcript_4296:345-1724(+)